MVRPQSQPQPQLQEPTRITIGRGYTMQIYTMQICTCERSSGHNPLQVME
ncbi:hypothetical protein ACFV8E_35610 [Streptomyces sp. NPDC059849]